MKLIALFFNLIFLFTIKGSSQPVETDVLTFTPKRQPFAEKENFVPSKTGFRLYPHVLYEMFWSEHSMTLVEVIDMDNKNIRLRRMERPYYRDSMSKIYDTITMPVADIRGIRIMGGNAKIGGRRFRFFDYNYQTEHITIPAALLPDTVINPTSGVTHIGNMRMTASGPQRRYIYDQDQDENMFVERLDSIQEVLSRPKKVKNILWFPPATASEINGIAIGLHTGNLTGRINQNPLKINGLNVNADILSTLLSAYAIMFPLEGIGKKKMAEQEKDVSGSNVVNGISISIGGLLDVKNIRGIAINGGICHGEKMSGMLISGGANVIDDVRGISIAGLRNRAFECRGLQIALVNSCKNLKGIQLGLWNVNSKRKLPLLNWSFN